MEAGYKYHQHLWEMDGKEIFGNGIFGVRYHHDPEVFGI
jgi:hypothetical protein